MKNLDSLILKLKELELKKSKLKPLIDECLIKNINFAKEFPDLNNDWNNYTFEIIYINSLINRV